MPRQSQNKNASGLPATSTTSSSSSSPPSNSIKAACLECRLNKVKCKVGESALACQRCERFGFECRFEAVNRRGRKPKSKLKQEEEISPSSQQQQQQQQQQQKEIDRLAILANASSSRKRTRNGSNSTSIDTNSMDEFLQENRFRRRAWQALMRNASMKGSTYTFVSSGDVGLSSNNHRSDGDQNEQPPSSNIMQPPSSNIMQPPSTNNQPTLRQLLCRIDRRFDGNQSRETTLPIGIRFDSPSHPCDAGIISQERCFELLSYFDNHLLPWIGTFSSAKDMFMGSNYSSFLLSVILFSASRFDFINGAQGELQSLGMHARSLAIKAFALADKGLDTLLAFDLLTIWKEPDDDWSEMYAAYTDQIATTPRTSGMDGKPLTENEANHALRVQLFHFVQRSVFQLHFLQSTNTVVDQHGVVLPLPSPSPNPPPLLALERFAAGTSTLYTDWFLCSDVEGTSIQSKYQVLLKQHQQGKFGSARNIVGPYLALLESFLAEMETWEQRWRRRGLRAADLRRGSNSMNSLNNTTIHQRIKSSESIQNDSIQQWAGFEILGHSICMHITAIAFRKGLDVWYDSIGQSSTLSANDTAAIELIERSYQACLDSTIGLLRRAIELNPKVLIHMPDSILVLINHAALLTVYLLLIPAAAAEGTSSMIKRKPFPDVLGNHFTTQKECLNTVKNAQEVVQKAASIKPLSSCCALSAEHLTSLVGLFEEADGVLMPEQYQQQHSQQQQGLQHLDDTQLRRKDENNLGSNMSSNNGTPINLQQQFQNQQHHQQFQNQNQNQPQVQPNIGWDWLQTFLDDSAVNMPYLGFSGM